MKSVRNVSYKWLDPELSWISDPALLIIVISTEDRKFVQFVADGIINTTFPPSMQHAKALDVLLSNKESLTTELWKAVAHPKRLGPIPSNPSLGENLDVYIVGAALLPGESRIAIAVSKSASPSASFLSDECRLRALELVTPHRKALQEFNEDIERQIDEARTKPDADVIDLPLYAKEALQSPQLPPASLLAHLLPRGVLVQAHTKDSIVQQRARRALSSCELTGSRDGTYTGLLPGRLHAGALGLVTWQPYEGPTSYPEIRASLNKRLPSAFLTPRQTDRGRPEAIPLAASASEPIANLSVEELERALADLRLNDVDSESAERFKDNQAKHGFEAIAWYQSHHMWSDDTWGIYFDSAKLDLVAQSTSASLRTGGHFAPHQFAALLAFGLVLEHEMFHARVDAAASWLEITTLRPRYRKYQSNVYQTAAGTSDWFEEAIANWCSWDWYKSDAVQDICSKMYRGSTQQLDRVVELSLDLSPPGYRDWRTAAKLAPWRILSSQLSSARALSVNTNFPLPLDGVLKGPFPFDLRTEDVPIRFVGEGTIAHRLLSHPANFHVPKRSEVVRALRHYNHKCDPRGGKGSHEKWIGPDNRTFSLPRRDPLSYTVFDSFLHYIGVDKSTYVRDIRPSL